MGNSNKTDDWASDDDANDLLAGILSDTENEAAAEQERIAAEIKAKEDEQRRQQQQQEARRKAEAQARITAEMDRQDALQKRREQRAEELRVEKLKATGQWEAPQLDDADDKAAQDSADEAGEAEAGPQTGADEVDAANGVQTPEHAAPASQRTLGEQTAPAPSSQSPLMLGLLAVVVVGLAIGGYAMTQGGYELDDTTYSKAVYQPKETEVKLVKLGFTPVPKKEKDQAKDDDEGHRSPPRTHHRSRHRPRHTRSHSKPKKKKKDKPKLDLDLDDTDPFGGDF